MNASTAVCENVHACDLRVVGNCIDMYVHSMCSARRKNQPVEMAWSAQSFEFLKRVMYICVCVCVHVHVCTSEFVCTNACHGCVFLRSPGNVTK